MVRSSYPMQIKHLPHILDLSIKKYVSVNTKSKEVHIKKNNGLSQTIHLLIHCNLHSHFSIQIAQNLYGFRNDIIRDANN
jgi:hypothetical protein